MFGNIPVQAKIFGIDARVRSLVISTGTTLTAFLTRGLVHHYYTPCHLKGIEVSIRRKFVDNKWDTTLFFCKTNSIRLKTLLLKKLGFPHMESMTNTIFGIIFVLYQCTTKIHNL